MLKNRSEDALASLAKLVKSTVMIVETVETVEWKYEKVSLTDSLKARDGSASKNGGRMITEYWEKSVENR